MQSATSTIYEPRGKAREYAPLAVNLYTGCEHKCEYCYAPATIHSTKEKFHIPLPRIDILNKIEKDAEKLQAAHQTGPVLLCFTCDPYQPLNEKYQLTRKAIQLLHSHKLNVMILTKGGQRAENDFDLLSDQDWFGTTLTCIDVTLSLKWEPGAALPEDRIITLEKAHEKGIKTWVSLEPVLYPDTVMEIVKKTYLYVDQFKIGTLNYHPHAQTINWHKFAIDVKNLLDTLRCQYYLKQDLRKWL
jgi:DNA repair photolyase